MDKYSKEQYTAIELCCAVCMAKIRSTQPSVIDCAYRAIDGELCEELTKCLDRIEKEK